MMSNTIDIGRKISVISNKIRHLFDASFANSGITGTQASILHFIYLNSEYGDVFQRDIEAAFDIRRSSVTSVLNGLERNGFIKREPVKEDARLKKLVLTGKAVEMSAHVKEVLENINFLMVHQFNQEELACLDTMLKRIAEKLP
jgi:DNA-binding MarR family transcriptional regulator